MNWRNGRERKRNAAEKDERKKNTAGPSRSMNAAERDKTEPQIEPMDGERIIRMMTTYTSPLKKITPNGLLNGLALA